MPENLAKASPLKPWCTALVAALVVGVWFWPGASDALIYDRQKILGGQLWRVVTGNAVHFSAQHLFWNLAILLPAGLWLERRNPAAARWTLLLAPLATGLGLLAFKPSLDVYAGVSGVAAGMLVALAVQGFRAEPSARWLWSAVLALFTVRLVADSIGQNPLFPGLAGQGIQSVPLAHLLGAAVGLGAALLHPPAKTRT